MKETIRDWMVENAGTPGLLACGVRFADKTSINESRSEAFPVAAMENAWRCIADAYQVLTLHRFPVARMRWVYEQAILACVRRSDGIILGLFLAPDSDTVGQQEVERLFLEFHALQKRIT